MGDMSTGALERWLTPGDGGDRNGHVIDPPGPPTGETGAVPVELVEMRSRLELLRATAELQRDSAWLDVLSPREEQRERAAAEKIRGLRIDQRVSEATAAVRLLGREQRASHRLASVELSERLWQRRALARRTRLLDPTSRLASVQRIHVATSAALMVLAIAGVAWTSVGVHDALVGPNGSPLAYVVEPLFSLPLLVIMLVQAVAAQWGRRFPAREHRGKVYALEAALLGATMLVNSASVLPVTGEWVDTTTLLAHLAPPALILVAVVLQPMIAAFLAGILADAHVDVGDAGGRRLEAETVDTLTLVAKVRSAIATGDLEVRRETGRPSTEAIRRFFGCEKRRAQGVADALALIDPGTERRESELEDR